MAKPATFGVVLPPNDIESMHQPSESVALMVTVSAKPQYGTYVAHCQMAGVPLIEKEAVPLTTLKVSELCSLLLERLALQVQMVRLAHPGGESGGGEGHGGGGEGSGGDGEGRGGGGEGRGGGGEGRGGEGLGGGGEGIGKIQLTVRPSKSFGSKRPG